MVFSLSLMVSKILTSLIRIYNCIISPLFPPCCRFNPTCSQYGLEAIQKFGIKKGIWLILKRILKCCPLHPGGYDPIYNSQFFNTEKK